MKAMTLLFSLLAAGTGLRAETPRELIGQGAREHAAGHEDNALALFERALATATNDTQAAAAASYNLGTLLYRKGDGEAAATRFKEALRTPDLTLQRDAFHNQGNLRMKTAAAREAENKLEDAVKEVAAALESYDGAMLLDPSAQDSRANIELALQYEKALKQKLEEQKKEQEKKDQEKKEQEKKDQEKKDQEKKEQEKKDQEKKDPKNQNQDQQNQDQKNQDQQKQDQEKKDQEKKDQEKKDREKEEQEKEKEARDFTQQQEKRKPGELTEEEALRMLEAQREEEKALRANFKIQHGSPERVQKDY